MGCSLVDDHEGVRVEDNQGKEVANEVFPQAWLAAETMPHGCWIALVCVDKVCAEGAVGFLSLENFFRFIRGLGGPCTHRPSLLGGSQVVEGGSHFGVNFPS